MGRKGLLINQEKFNVTLKRINMKTLAAKKGNNQYQKEGDLFEIDGSNYELSDLKHQVMLKITNALMIEGIANNEPVIDFVADTLSSMIICKFSNRFLTKPAGVFKFKWYSSWWQELRNKILPKWYLDKFPSRKETKKWVLATTVYPTIEFDGKKHGHTTQWDEY